MLVLRSLCVNVLFSSVVVDFYLFTEVLNCTDLDKALATWYNVYLTVVNVDMHL